MALYYKDKWWGEYLEDYDYDDGRTCGKWACPYGSL